MTAAEAAVEACSLIKGIRRAEQIVVAIDGGFLAG